MRREKRSIKNASCGKCSCSSCATSESRAAGPWPSLPQPLHVLSLDAHQVHRLTPFSSQSSSACLDAMELVKPSASCLDKWTTPRISALLCQCGLRHKKNLTVFPLRFSLNRFCGRQNPLLPPTLWRKLPILPSPPIPRPSVSTNSDFLPILFYFWCCDKIPWQTWKAWELSFLISIKRERRKYGNTPDKQ